MVKVSILAVELGETELIGTALLVDVLCSALRLVSEVLISSYVEVLEICTAIPVDVVIMGTVSEHLFLRRWVELGRGVEDEIGTGEEELRWHGLMP